MKCVLPVRNLGSPKLRGVKYERVLATTFGMTFMRRTNSTAQEKTSPARVLDSAGGSDADDFFI